MGEINIVESERFGLGLSSRRENLNLERRGEDRGRALLMERVSVSNLWWVRIL